MKEGLNGGLSVRKDLSVDLIAANVNHVLNVVKENNVSPLVPRPHPVLRDLSTQILIFLGLVHMLEDSDKLMINVHYHIKIKNNYSFKSQYKYNYNFSF